MKQTDNDPANLVVESYQLMGARRMLQRIIDTYKVSAKTKCDKDDPVYTKAELDMILSSVDNVRHFLCGDYRIRYRNHVRDKKGRLIKCEAYFAP